MDGRKAYRIELAGDLVWEGDDTGCALEEWHALARTHGRAVSDFDAYALLPEPGQSLFDEIRYEYVDVSPLELERMWDYELSVD